MSDTGSIASAFSVQSSNGTGAQIGANPQHPVFDQPGLSTSIIETVNATFSENEPTKMNIVGEVAFAYQQSSDHNPEQLKIGISGLSGMSKVAPNRAFVSSTPGDNERFTLNLRNLAQTSIGLKYLKAPTSASGILAACPLRLKVMAKVDQRQADIMIVLSVEEHLIFKNLAIALSLTGANILNCQTKPLGTYNRDRMQVVWRLDDDTATLNPGKDLRLLARLSCEGKINVKSADARWQLIDASKSPLHLQLVDEDHVALHPPTFTLSSGKYCTV